MTWSHIPPSPIDDIMASTSFTIFLASALVMNGVQASSECWTYIHNGTIPLFNSAPITFSYDVNTATDCLKWCGQVEKCEAWVFVEHSKQCDLHPSTALTIDQNTGFTFGGCDPTTADESQLVVDVPIPSASAATSSVRVETGPSNLVCFSLSNLTLFRAAANHAVLSFCPFLAPYETWSRSSQTQPPPLRGDEVIGHNWRSGFVLRIHWRWSPES